MKSDEEKYLEAEHLSASINQEKLLTLIKNTKKIQKKIKKALKLIREIKENKL